MGALLGLPSLFVLGSFEKIVKVGWAWPDFSKKQLRWAVFGKTSVHRICQDWALLENAGVGCEGFDCAGPGRAVTRFNTVARTPR